MHGFIPELLEMICSEKQIAILSLDQSKLSNGFECLMVAVLVGERAIPVGWRVIETEGEIGFEIQKSLLESISKMIPEGIQVLLSADRFYGTAASHYANSLGSNTVFD